MSEGYERIEGLLEYLNDGDYDDGRDGYLEVRPVGTSGNGEYHYNVAFERAGEKLQTWAVTIHEDAEL